MEEKRFDEKLILMYVPYALARVEQSKNLTIDELRAYKKQSGDFFRYVRKNGLDEHIAFLTSHRKDAYFGQYIEKMLSHEGVKWLKANYPIMRQVAEEQ